MITTLAVENYRSLNALVMPLAPLTVVTGANGVGKSNLYGALSLLSAAARGQVVSALAMQGGLSQVMWAGPAKISRAMERREVPVQGGPRKGPSRIRLGFSGDDFAYSIELGMPVPAQSLFNLDPIIKRESIWHGATYRKASVLVERNGAVLKRRNKRQLETVTESLAMHDSLFDHAGDPTSVPEVFSLRESIRAWRFYANFRTDANAPARRTMVATRTPVLNHDGCDLAAALQTILEVGDSEGLADCVDDAFPGSRLEIQPDSAHRLEAVLWQPGLLRGLRCSEWSDGTLRYMLLIAALFTPRPPPLMILNEPETSLHPELIEPLARLIKRASEHSQLWVISHASALVRALEANDNTLSHQLEKNLGRTQIAGLHALDVPAWRWQ